MINFMNGDLLMFAFEFLSKEHESIKNEDKCIISTQL